MTLVRQDVANILDRIPASVVDYLEECYDQMVIGRNDDDELFFQEFHHKLMGVLDCLTAQKIITDADSSKLYRYYTNNFWEE